VARLQEAQLHRGWVRLGRGSDERMSGFCILSRLCALLLDDRHRSYIIDSHWTLLLFQRGVMGLLLAFFEGVINVYLAWFPI
jgi:hypothetical protein